MSNVGGHDTEDTQCHRTPTRTLSAALSDATPEKQVEQWTGHQQHSERRHHASRQLEQDASGRCNSSSELPASRQLSNELELETMLGPVSEPDCTYPNCRVESYAHVRALRLQAARTCLQMRIEAPFRSASKMDRRLQTLRAYPTPLGGQAMPCCAGHWLQYPCFVYRPESALLYIGYASLRTKGTRHAYNLLLVCAAGSRPT